MSEDFTLKWSLLWTFIHSFSLILINFLLSYVNLPSSFFYYLLLGLGVTILARTILIFTRKTKFIIDKFFFYWVSIHSVTLWLMSLFINFLNISNSLISTFLMSIGLVTVAFIVRKIDLKNRYILLVSIILLILLFLFTSTSLNPSQSNQSPLLRSNFGDSLKNIFSLSFSKDCPQVNVPLQQKAPLSYIQLREYEGWTIAPYDTTTMFGLNLGMIYCHKGSKQGQNPNYWYCGDDSSQTTMAFMQKTFINSDGSIGKTIRQSFYNIYDENKNFLKTVCGDDPEEISKQEFKSFMSELDEFQN